jgi:hypothetical protein
VYKGNIMSVSVSSLNGSPSSNSAIGRPVAKPTVLPKKSPSLTGSSRGSETSFKAAQDEPTEPITGQNLGQINNLSATPPSPSSDKASAAGVDAVSKTKTPAYVPDLNSATTADKTADPKQAEADAHSSNMKTVKDHLDKINMHFSNHDGTPLSKEDHAKKIEELKNPSPGSAAYDILAKINDLSNNYMSPVNNRILNDIHKDKEGVAPELFGKKKFSELNSNERKVLINKLHSETLTPSALKAKNDQNLEKFKSDMEAYNQKDHLQSQMMDMLTKACSKVIQGMLSLAHSFQNAIMAGIR